MVGVAVTVDSTGEESPYLRAKSFSKLFICLTYFGGVLLEPADVSRHAIITTMWNACGMPTCATIKRQYNASNIVHARLSFSWLINLWLSTEKLRCIRQMISTSMRLSAFSGSNIAEWAVRRTRAFTSAQVPTAYSA